jgi:hypothetical protein
VTPKPAWDASATAGRRGTTTVALHLVRRCSSFESLSVTTATLSAILDTDDTHARDGKDGSFVFKRTSHLIEGSMRAPVVRTHVIPPEVFGNILVELKKRKITNLATVSLSQIKS